MTREIVCADIGGTHARFGIASIAQSRVTCIQHEITYNTSDHTNFHAAWNAYRHRVGRAFPAEGAIGIAGHIGGTLIRFSNNPWTIAPSFIRQQLQLDRLTLVNDFGAIGHAITQLTSAEFTHCCGPEIDLPRSGTISIIGPGTGLGVAQIHYLEDGSYHVVETEGGHMSFSAEDQIDDAIIADLRQKHTHISAERIVSGPGLSAIYHTLAKIAETKVSPTEDVALWDLALSGNDPLALAALERFCMNFGSVAGDIALAHGSNAVVLSGGIGSRIAHMLPASGFYDCFTAKGRYARLMQLIPVKILNMEQPGLHGAAAAFLAEHRG